MTLYHSNYNSQNTFPITLTYTLKEVSHVDYAVYTPRQDGNVNGNFQEVTVSYQVGNKWTTLATLNFEGSSAASRIPFGDNGVDDVKAVRFVVKSGTNGFASCSEMEFYTKNNFMEELLHTYFTDNLCTQLREGVTAQEIEQIPVAEIRNMAKAMRGDEHRRTGSRYLAGRNGLSYHQAISYAAGGDRIRFVPVCDVRSLARHAVWQ